VLDKASTCVFNNAAQAPKGRCDRANLPCVRLWPGLVSRPEYRDFCTSPSARPTTVHRHRDGRALYSALVCPSVFACPSVFVVSYLISLLFAYFWLRWTRLPVAGEYKHRLKRQKAMAERLSQLPPLDKTVDRAKRSNSSLGFSTTGRGVERYDRSLSI
jgi:hypothetical protein